MSDLACAAFRRQGEQVIENSGAPATPPQRCDGPAELDWERSVGETTEAAELLQGFRRLVLIHLKGGSAHEHPAVVERVADEERPHLGER